MNQILSLSKYLSLGIGLCTALQSFAQTGLPLYRNYTYKDFKTTPLMWATTQDNKGVLYFANRDGVLQFDGYHWQLLPTPSAVRTVAVDTSGRIYVGCQGDFGHFEPDKNQKLKFVSFKKQLPTNDKDFTEIEDVYISKDQSAYYVSRGRVFRAHREANNLTTLRPYRFEIMGSGFYNNELYINISGKGLHTFANGSPRLVGGGDVFADKEMTFLQPLPNNRVLLGSAYEGLFVMQNNSITPLATGLEGYFRTNLIYDGTVTSGGTIAVATAYGGLVLLNSNGGVLKTITKNEFLPSNDLYSIYADTEGGVWVGHSEGITYFAPDLPIQTYEKLPGLQGKITSICQAGGVIYLATINGVFSLDPVLSTAFNPLPLPKTEYRTIIASNGRLLVAGNVGVFDITGGGAIPIIQNEISLTLFQSRKNPGLVYVALEKGLQKLVFNGTGYTPAEKYEKLTDQFNSIYETDNNQLWLGTNNAGAIRVEANGTFTRFGTDQGLTDGYVNIRVINNIPYFITSEGCFVLKGDKFEKDPAVSAIIPNKNYQVSEDGRGGYYVYANDGIKTVRFDNKIQVDSSALGNIIGEKADRIAATAENVWLGFQDKLVGINLKAPGSQPKPFKALIRSVKLGEDSLFYQGVFWDENGNFSNKQTKLFRPLIDYNYNSLTFEFGTSSYYNPEGTQFQYFLEGNDGNWSSWHSEPRAIYTNLFEGTYTLKVRARNALGMVSDVETFEFRVAPPLYRSYPAIFMYLIGLVGIGVGAVRVNSRRLKAQNIKLEATIKERTKEIEQQKTELERSNILLEEQKENLDQAYKSLQNTQAQLVQSEKMATLGTLIAGVAHEINTPIGAVGAAATNVNKALPVVTQKLPQIFKTFSPEQEKLFFELVERSLNFTGTLSSRDERNYRKTVTETLEAMQIPNASNLAKDLVKIGLFDKLDVFKPLFASTNCEEIVDLASAIGKLRVNLDNIGIAVQKTQKIVFALKSYSHRQIDETAVETNIAENIETVLVVYQNQLKQGVEVVKSYDATKLPLTYGYPDELNQVWTNLISNGIQAMESQGKLEIVVQHEKTKDANNILVKIIDSGPGIPEHILPRIFEAFFTTKVQGEGTGLGLDICRRIIDKHKGKINVETQPGRTCFTVTLPVITDPTVFNLNQETTPAKA